MQRESGESPAQRSAAQHPLYLSTPSRPTSAVQCSAVVDLPCSDLGLLCRRRVGGANGRLAWMVLEHRGGNALESDDRMIRLAAVLHTTNAFLVLLLTCV
jgi:hypothetical protein